MGNIGRLAANYLLVLAFFVLAGATSVLNAQPPAEEAKPIDPAVIDATLYDLKKEAESSEMKYEIYLKLNDYFRAAKRYEERTKYFLTLSSIDRANVCAFYFAAQGSPYDEKKELFDRAIHGFDGIRGRRCSGEAAFWAGRYYDEPTAGRTRNEREAYRYYRLALYRDPDIPNVKAAIAKLDPAVVAEGDASSAADEPERIRKVTARYNEDYRTIQSSLTRYNAYVKERANVYQITPKRSSDLLASMKRELLVQIDIAQNALSELSGQFDSTQKAYYERILATAKEKLGSLPLQ